MMSAISSPSAHTHKVLSFNNINSVVGVVKMGNIVPRVVIENASLAFRASVLPLHHVSSLMSPLYHAYLSIQLLA